MGGHVDQAPGTRVERILVQRDVQHVPARREHLLGGVAVMNIPIDDRDPPAPLDQHGGGDRHAVEKAEAHGDGAAGMVSGRPHGQEGGAGPAFLQPPYRQGPGAGGSDGRLPRSLDRARVGVQRSPACRAEPLDPFHVVGGVDQLDQPPVGHRRLLRDYLHRGLPHTVESRPQPVRAFRVPGPGIVAGERGMRDDQKPHRVEATPARDRAARPDGHPGSGPMAGSLTTSQWPWLS